MSREVNKFYGNYFDLYEFFCVLADKWFIYFIFVFYVLFNTLSERNIGEYRAYINHIHSPQEYVFPGLVNITIKTESERLFINKLIKKKLAEQSLQFKVDNNLLTLEENIEKNFFLKELINLRNYRKRFFTINQVENFLRNTIISDFASDKKYKFEVKRDLLDNTTVSYVSVSTEESNKEEAILLLNKITGNLIRYVETLVEEGNVITPNFSKWIGLGYEFEEVKIFNYYNKFRKFVLILFILIIINLIINSFQKKAFSIKRVSQFLNAPVNLIVDSRKSPKNLIHKLQIFNKSLDKKYKWYFHIIESNNPSNSLTLKKIKNSKKLDLININTILDKINLSEKFGLIVIVGHGFNSTIDLYESNFIFQESIKVPIKVIYFSNSLGLL